MKTTIFSLILVLLAAGCSRKPTASTTEATAALPQFTFAAGDLASPAKVATNKLGAVSVDIKLSESKADELCQFTRAHLNHQVQIMLGPKVLVSPVINMVVSNGEVEVTFGSSDTNAQVVADLVNRK